MKMTQGAISNLCNRYRAVLKKCHLINTFGSLAMAAMLVMGGASAAAAAETTDKVLSEDIANAVSVPAGNSVNLDLNGYKIFTDNTYALYVNGNVTVSDSVGTGMIEGKSYSAVVNGNGVLRLESGLINLTNAGNPIQVQQGGQAFISGGTVSGYDTGICLYAEGQGQQATVTIEGDSVVKTTAPQWQQAGDPVPAAVFLTPGNGGSATLNVHGGTIYSSTYAIVGNGTRHGTTINITGGDIRSDATAIYHPQDGVMTISGGTIDGAQTGIELRSGKLTVTGGKISGRGNPHDYDPNGNGTTTVGAALAVSQHTTNKDIDVNISGGTLTGYYALFENDLQDDQSDNIQMSVTGGEFNGKIYSENCKDFITGGTFSDPTALHYLGDGANIRVALQQDYNGETGELNKQPFAIGSNRTVAMDLGGHTFSMTEAGNTSAGNVSMANGTLNLAQGLTLTGGTLDMVSGSSLTIADGSSLTIDGGAFVSDASLLLKDFSSTADGITDAKIVGTAGNLNLRLEDGASYTLNDINSAKAALLSNADEKANLNFLNGTLKLEDGEQLVAGATGSDGSLTLTTGPVVAGSNETASAAQNDGSIASIPDQYVAVVDALDPTKELLSASAIAIEDSGFTAKGLQIKDDDNAGTVTLAIGDDTPTTSTVVTLVGDGLQSTGVVDGNGEALASAVEVKAGSTLNMGLEGNTADQGLALTEAAVSGTINVNGGVEGTTSTYAIDTLTMNPASQVNVLNSTMNIGEFTASGGTLFVDPAYVNIGSVSGGTLATQLLVGAGSTVNIGGVTDADMLKAMTDAGMSVGPNLTVGDSQSVLAVASPILLNGNGQVVVAAGVDANGQIGGAPVTAGAYFDSDSLLIVDAGKLAGSAAIDGATGDMATVLNGAKLQVVNATSGDVTVLSGFATDLNVEDGGWGYNSTSVINPDRMLNSTIKVDKAAGNVIVSSAVNKASDVLPGLSPELNAPMAYVWDNALNDVNAADSGVRFLSRAARNDYVADAGKAARTIESASRMAFAGAVPQMTKLASDAATTTMINRLSLTSPIDGSKAVDASGQLVDRNNIGFALWFAPLWQYQRGWSMDAGSLNYGYEGNLGGATLGADYTFDNAIRAGVTLSVGGGHAESHGGDLAWTENDMDFWSVGAYAGWTRNNFALMADLSYTQSSSELNQNLDPGMGMGNLSADVDGRALSMGVRAEYKLATSLVDVVPHLGVRYMWLDTRGYDVKAGNSSVLESDGFSQNIWTFPVGVTFSKDFTMDNGWYVKPNLDVSVIPAAGDVDGEDRFRFTGVPVTTSMETQIMDHLTWQGGVGLELGNNDNMSLGVNYILQAGEDVVGHGVFGIFSYKF